MLFVENCKLYADRFCGDPEYHVFCYPKRSEDFDVVGTFCDRDTAEAFCEYMRTHGGKVSYYGTRQAQEAFCAFLENRSGISAS